MNARGSRVLPARRLYLTMMAIFVAGACLATFLAFNREAEPVFEGRNLSQWLPEIQSQDTARHRKAVEAFREMGPRAVPFLVADLKRNDSFLKAKIFALVRQQAPSLRARLMSQDERHQRSMNVLRQMQPYSKEIIAALSAHLTVQTPGSLL